MKDTFKMRLCDIDLGRFDDIIHALNVEDICEECKYFDESKLELYRCYVFGRCIGATLNEELKKYLIERIK